MTKRQDVPLTLLGTVHETLVQLGRASFLDVKTVVQARRPLTTAEAVRGALQKLRQHGRAKQIASLWVPMKGEN